MQEKNRRLNAIWPNGIHIERLNLTYEEEEFGLYTFFCLSEVRDIKKRGIKEYNKERPY